MRPLRRDRSVQRLALLACLLWAAAAHAQATGTLEGRVTEAKRGEALIEASIKVVKGPEGTVGKETRTDVDGNFKLTLPPGRYELRVFSEGLPARQLGDLEVLAGQARKVEIVVGAVAAPSPPASPTAPSPPPPHPSEGVDEVVVEARTDRKSEASLLQQRKKAATVTDSIGAEQIARSPDSNASDAAKRVVSATVIDNKYVLLRGLGGRYSQTLLNGAELPSPDPDEQAIPLDLFPAALLANLTVIKTYTPELPGAFSAGSLLIETNSYPERFELKLSLGTEVTSSATFRRISASPYSSTDWIGFDNGNRALPSAVPRDQPVRVGTGLSPGQVEAIGESFRNVWSLKDRFAFPNATVGASGGASHRFDNGSKLGWLASFNYAHRFRVVEAEGAAVRLEGSGGEARLAVRERYTEVTGIESVTLGGLGSLGYQLDRNHQLGLISLITRQTDIRGTGLDGYSESDGLPIRDTRLLFVSRSLWFNQLRGEHRLRPLELSWQANVSLTRRSEPDTRDMTYNGLGDGVFRFRNQPGSGERFFSELTDTSVGGGLNLTIPLADRWKLKTGGMVQYTTRSFAARRFRYDFVGQDPSVLLLPPEQMLSAQQIGPSFRLEERTLQADAYTASLLVGGVYLMGDAQLTKKLRLVAGLRYEGASQKLTPGSPFAITDTAEPGVDRTTHSPLPALNLVYALTPTMNLRAAYSYTLARPRFRELAPFLYFDFSRRRAISGNPNLVETRIHNNDLRWELFPADGAVVAATVFYKYFEKPIEQVIFNVAEGDISYANAEAAHTLGGELEVRSSFKFLSPRLSELSVGANLTLIYSRVRLADADVGALTSASRPLQGQSPYVVNFSLAWNRERTGTQLAVLYNVYGRRISDVGFDRLPDIYEEPFHRLDVSVSQRIAGGLRIKLAGSNLTNSALTYTQGELVVYRFRPGVVASAALEWTLF